MNPDLAKLQPYPFERLRLLFKDITPDPRHTAINLGIGEPKHPTPELMLLCSGSPTIIEDNCFIGARSEIVEDRLGVAFIQDRRLRMDGFSSVRNR